MLRRFLSPASALAVVMLGQTAAFADKVIQDQEKKPPGVMQLLGKTVCFGTTDPATRCDLRLPALRPAPTTTEKSVVHHIDRMRQDLLRHVQAAK